MALAAAGLGAVLLGLAQAWSVASPLDGQPSALLQLLSLAGLVVLLGQARHLPPPQPQDTAAAPPARHIGRVAALGGLFAWAWIAGCTWWLFISMHVYGGLHPLLAALAVAALAAFLALYYAAAAAAWAAWAPRHIWGQAALLAAAWTLAELARGRWLTGFPWGAGGYAHVDGPLAALAPWLGVYGIGAVAVWCAALVGLALHRWLQSARGRADAPAPAGQGTAEAAAVGDAATGEPRDEPGREPGHGVAGRVAGGVSGGVAGGVATAAAALLLGVLAAWPADWTASTGSLSLRLLQGNIPQDEKFQPGSGVPLALNWYGARLQGTAGPGHAPADLVVAPETAIPLLPRQLPEGYWATLLQRYSSGEQAALIGLPLGSLAEGYTNSVIGLAPGQRDAYVYHKHHLVPFGEFIPPLFRWFTDLMNIPLGDFSRGAVGQPSMAWKGQRLAPNICYEDLFGEELAARFAPADAAPTILVNLSNIGWFGNTVAIDQHLHISRMRALEFQRPMVRATNTGATVVIDHQGRVTHRLAPHTRAVLDAQVQGRQGLTPYARWAGAVGLWPLWLLGVAGVLLAWRAAARARRLAGHPAGAPGT